MIEAYDNALKGYRKKFFERTRIDHLDRRQIVYTLLHMYSKGIRMTEPVPYWITRAGTHCKELGFSKIGDALKMHASHEAGHHKLYKNDFNRLKESWLADSGENVDLFFESDEVWPFVQKYIMLHENVINGAEPYCQVAIELEIEGVSSKAGSAMVDHISKTLSPTYVSNCMSFITEHAEIDVGHTKFNRGLLSQLLQDPRVNLDALVQAGKLALDIFGEYIESCIDAGEKCIVKRFASDHKRDTAIQLLVESLNDIDLDNLNVKDLFAEAAALTIADSAYNSRFENRV